MKNIVIGLSILTILVSCNSNQSKSSQTTHEEPKLIEFTLFGDLKYNQKEDSSQQSAYIHREYFYKGNTFKIEFTPRYENGVLKSLSASPFIWGNPINCTLFCDFLSLNFLGCKREKFYGAFPIQIQQQVNEIIKLHWEQINIANSEHQFLKTTKKGYEGSQEWIYARDNIASLLLENVFISFDGNSVVELDVPINQKNPAKSEVNYIHCYAYNDYLELKKSEIQSAISRYNFQRKQYGF